MRKIRILTASAVLATSMFFAPLATGIAAADGNDYQEWTEKQEKWEQEKRKKQEKWEQEKRKKSEKSESEKQEDSWGLAKAKEKTLKDREGRRLNGKAVTEDELAARCENNRDSLKERAVKAADSRIKLVRNLQSSVEKSDVLTEAHKSALLAKYSAAVSGLTELKSEIQSATECAQIAEIAAKIFSDHRVLVLLVPQTRMVFAFDRGQKTVTRLKNTSTRIETVLAELKAKGVDVSDAEAALTRVKTKLAEIDSKLSGKADELLTLAPGSYSPSSMRNFRETLHSIKKDFVALAADLRLIKKALKAQREASPTPSTEPS